MTHQNPQSPMLPDSSLIERAQRRAVTILIPCWNEEATIERCVHSCLDQTVPAHQVLVVNDSSTDRSAEILARFGDRITVVTTPHNSGNKSAAQEFGLQFVKGHIFITTDGDTILHRSFVENILKTFDADPGAASVCGYVSSLRHNWLTRCRAYEYEVGQRIHKLAQGYIDSIFVIPGAAGAFRTDLFRKYCPFDHDTITEDLDITYKLHEQGLRIAYNPNAIVYTQDPATIRSYVNQMRRWLGGGWQNLMKHFKSHETMSLGRILELSLIYVEGIIYATLFLILPFINPIVFLTVLGLYFLNTALFAVFATVTSRRMDLLLVPFTYLLLMYINSYIFVEQFIKEVILRRKNLVWFKPQRVTLS